MSMWRMLMDVQSSLWNRLLNLSRIRGMKPKDLKKAKALCETFQEEFIEKWHEHMDDNDE
jgi:hypothetical protein